MCIPSLWKMKLLQCFAGVFLCDLVPYVGKIFDFQHYICGCHEIYWATLIVWLK